MPNLYTIATQRVTDSESITDGERISVLYHDLFDFPLNFSEIIKWVVAPGIAYKGEDIEVKSKNGYLFVGGKEGNVYKRTLRKRISERKLQIAKKAANILSFIPGIKVVAVTGSLAMENANEESDIDLLLITKKGQLWTTRLVTLVLFSLIGFPMRKSGDKSQKDKLCLNMWIDESDLVWRERNLYTAHEIAQIIPLVNKDKTYETFINKNKWIKNFWPNSIKTSNSKLSQNTPTRTSLLEKIAFNIQYLHMKSKITREIVKPTRAIFHPQDWGKVVLSRLTP